MARAAPAEGAFELEHAPRGAYSLLRTCARFARFGDSVNKVGANGYARLVRAGAGVALVRVAQHGPPTRARLRVRVAHRGAGDEAAHFAALRVLERVLGAGSDLRPFARAFRADPILGNSVSALRGLRVSGTFDLFEALVNAVLTQQVNLRFAYSIRAELARAYGRAARLDGARWVAFPDPARLARATEAELRGFRLSAAKAGTLLRVARACADGALDEAHFAGLSDDCVVERLCELKGIGRWTAEVVLIRGLGRLDVFPAGDLTVLKRLAPSWLGRAAGEAEMRAFAARFSPYRSLAMAYAVEALAAARTPPRSSSPGRSSRTRSSSG